MSTPDIRDLDPQLVRIYEAAVDLYNRQNKAVASLTETSASINATHFLTRQTIVFATAALRHMEDAHQPLMPAVALLRTCLEAQARANHIVAATGVERERLANQFIDMMAAGYDYYRMMITKVNKDDAADIADLPSKAQAIFAAIKPMVENVDTSTVGALEDRYKDLLKKWTYNNVIGKKSLNDPKWKNRTQVQRLQSGLHVIYVKCCAFVHSDPTSMKLEKELSLLEESHTAVLAIISAINSFFIALGKEDDAALQELNAAMVAFPLAEKTFKEMGYRLPSNG
ncbi:MAG: hypothetical protein ABSA97_12885 [Verrucomicrobiia bacterium]